MNSVNLFELTGRTALVTGSTRGLGRAIAEGLGQAGAALVVNGRNAEATKAAAQELREAGIRLGGENSLPRRKSLRS